MDTTNRLFVWIACTAGAVAIGMIALVGLRYYGPMGRHPDMAGAETSDQKSLPNTPSTYQTSSIRGAHIDHLFAQRSQIKRLQTLLDQKTRLLEKKTVLLERNTAEQSALKRELDEAIALLEMLAGQMSDTSGLNNEDEVANGELHEDLERLKEQRQENELQAREQDDELRELVAELAATDEEIARLKQESEIEFRVLLAQKEAFETVASRALVIIGSEAVPVLVEQLSHPRADIRQWAARVLGEIGPDANEATPALIDALSDSDAGVREAARHSLELIDSVAPNDGGTVQEPIPPVRKFGS